MEEVVGSIPTRSTKSLNNLNGAHAGNNGICVMMCKIHLSFPWLEEEKTELRLHCFGEHSCSSRRGDREEFVDRVGTGVQKLQGSLIGLNVGSRNVDGPQLFSCIDVPKKDSTTGFTKQAVSSFSDPEHVAFSNIRERLSRARVKYPVTLQKEQAAAVSRELCGFVRLF